MSKGFFDDQSYDWGGHDDRMKECAAIRKDCSIARGIISDGMARYIKKKLNARTKRLAADMNLMFADLSGYQSEAEILDAYGYGFIDEKIYDRLINLWRLRQEYVDKNGRFSDRVTELLQIAINTVGEQYHDFLADTEEADRVRSERIAEIERKNGRFRYEQYVKGLRGERG